MKRNEVIKSAAEYTYANKIGIQGFIDGAKWADRNPAWRNTRTERPKDGESVLAVVDVGGKRTIRVCTYRECDKWVLFGSLQHPIDLWMPLPKIPALAIND